jgi:putative tryptophan/tyrosine transport system substrate-binding protein
LNETARVHHAARRRGSLAARSTCTGDGEAADHWVPGAATSSSYGQWVAAFVQRLRELGWIEGRTVAIEVRWAEGHTERLSDIAAEFVRLKVDIIVTHSAVPVLAAMQATSVIPIVIASAADPVSTGLVASLAHPGGNVTGLSLQVTDLAGKRVELLREVVPGMRRLAIMANVGAPAAVLEMGEAQAAARTLGLEVITSEIQRGEDIVPAFEALNGRAEALYVSGDPLVFAHRIRINTLALAERLPTMYGPREHVDGEVSYPMDQTSRPSTAAPPSLSTRFCAGQSRATSRSSSRPNSIWS